MTEFQGPELAKELKDVPAILMAYATADNVDRQLTVIQALNSKIGEGITQYGMTQNEVIHALLYITAGALIIPNKGVIDEADMDNITEIMGDYFSLMIHHAKGGQPAGCGPTARAN